MDERSDYSKLDTRWNNRNRSVLGSRMVLVGVNEPIPLRGQISVESAFYIELEVQEESWSGVPKNTEFKPWMDYRTITDKSSRQWSIVRGNKVRVDDDGLMYVDQYLLVALGTKFGGVGDRLQLKMDTGEIIDVMIADQKQDTHTKNGNGWNGNNGHIIELVVDSTRLPSDVKRSGSCDAILEGKVTGFRVIKKY